MDSRHDLLDPDSREIAAGNVMPDNDLVLHTFTLACRRAGFNASEIEDMGTRLYTSKISRRQAASNIKWWFDRDVDRP